MEMTLKNETIEEIKKHTSIIKGWAYFTDSYGRMYFSVGVIPLLKPNRGDGVESHDDYPLHWYFLSVNMCNEMYYNDWRFIHKVGMILMHELLSGGPYISTIIDMITGEPCSFPQFFVIPTNKKLCTLFGFRPMGSAEKDIVHPIDYDLWTHNTPSGVQSRPVPEETLLRNGLRRLGNPSGVQSRPEEDMIIE